LLSEGDSLEAASDEPSAAAANTSDAIINYMQVTSRATDSAHFPGLNRTLPSAEIDSSLPAGSFNGDELHIPQQQQPLSPELLLDESTL
jgi:hypothetical protein